ncbi:hypothetical protein VTL71DRAFT_8911, partial [Oculimacula yallundae]
MTSETWQLLEVEFRKGRIQRLLQPSDPTDENIRSEVRLTNRGAILFSFANHPQQACATWITNNNERHNKPTDIVLTR